jgi:sporulation protein YlmC with PRC-barrel domain
MFSLYKKNPKSSRFLLTGVSALTFLIAFDPAMASNERTSNQSDVPSYSEEEVKDGLNEAKEAVSETVNDVSEVAQEMYQEIKSAFSDNDKAIKNPVKINMRMTALGIIGKPVYNQAGGRIAVVRDIILNKDGKAVMVVLGDGDWLGLGKLAAFDYSIITKTNNDGDFVAPITEAMIDNSAPFSYEASKGNSNVKMIPENGYSVSALLGSDLVDAQGQKMANIENISFNNGKANLLVVGFDQIFGMGGEKAAMHFDDPNLYNNKDGNKPYFKLSDSKSMEFEAFKKRVTN